MPSAVDWVDDNLFIRHMFMIELGEDFTTYKDAVKWMAEDASSYEDGTQGTVQQAIDFIAEDDGKPFSLSFNKRKCRDTTLGGNNAINCYPQYCEFDDPVYELFDIQDSGGMGATYSSEIDDTQQLLFLTFGLPEYPNLLDFYKDLVIPDLARMVNGGGFFTPANLGYLAGKTAIGFITLPLAPIVYLFETINSIGNAPITRYVELRPEMAMYYRYVNSILIHLAVNMGLASTDYDGLKGEDAEQDLKNLPSIFRESGFDIHRILLRKYRYEDGQRALNGNGNTYTDAELFSRSIGLARTDMTEDISNLTVSSDTSVDAATFEAEVSTGVKKWSHDLFHSFKYSMYDASMFIGLRIEKSVDSSESISNQTTESPVAQAINSKVQSIRSLKDAAMGFNVGDFGAIGDVLGSVADFIGGAVSSVAGGGPAMVLTGAGMVDIPEVWQSSSMSKSYNFKLSCRAPAGDPVSIMQSCYVPLALLFAGAAPRAVGNNTYSSPFYLRAYSKGLFAVPYGMIESITIERGGETHGWNIHMQPVVINISFSIKDLSPAIFMAMGSPFSFADGLLGGPIGANTSFQEYLLTLSGAGLTERLTFGAKWRRMRELLRSITWDQTLSGAVWGNALADTTIGRIINKTVPARFPD